jgi:glycerol-3-phosphate acyltransferase PlsX
LPQKTVHIAVDMMSGDSGLRITVPAALQALSDYPHLVLHLAGDEASLQNTMADWPNSAQTRVNILHAPVSVEMGDQASSVLRNNDVSSMKVALEALAADKVSAVISAGNAGALMVLARKLVGMLQASSRPAFCSKFPTEKGASLMLDLGANVDCTPEQLYSFAVLGNALFSCLYPESSPSVALLSNGTESNKGNTQVKRAAKLLSSAPDLNYVGYIEANALHNGNADVVVCDGFVGNIALKAIEGTAELARETLAELLAGNNAHGDQWQSLLAEFSKAMDPELHNGAFLLGLAGVVVKAHGDSSVEGFVASIGQALKCDEQNMVARIEEQLASVGE